jgi:hypothetical protein
MIHSFNSSATEIADYTWNNLIDMGYMKFEDLQLDTTIPPGDFNAIDPTTINSYYGAD